LAAQSKIPAAELRKYMKLPLDQALSRPGCDVRILPDGRVLYKLTAVRGTHVWSSREEFMEWQRRGDEAVARGPVDLTLTLLPPIDDFLRDVEALAKSLGPRLRILDEALDGTVASLAAVDKALKRIPWIKRQVSDLVTPLVAYVGEVLRRASGGRWIKPPPTYKRWENVYDPAETAAYWTAVVPIAEAAAKKAGAEARARRASASDVALAINMARDAAYREVQATQPKPVRSDWVEHPMRGSMNEPVITASNGRSFQPFAIVIIPMVEPSKRLPLRAAVATHLTVNGYPLAPEPAA
jgi:hypothetical protein